MFFGTNLVALMTRQLRFAIRSSVPLGVLSRVLVTVRAMGRGWLWVGNVLSSVELSGVLTFALHAVPILVPVAVCLPACVLVVELVSSPTMRLSFISGRRTIFHPMKRLVV